MKCTWTSCLIIVVCPLLLSLVPASPESRAGNTEAGAWSVTGSLNTARYAHTATLLLDGRVLVAGGRGLRRITVLECRGIRPGHWALDAHRRARSGTARPHGHALA
jgi:hypothetical protein